MTRPYTADRARGDEPLGDRILRHVKVDEETGCWIWQLRARTNGYGRITVRYQNLFSHRVSYEAFVGPIPEGLQLDHLCRNRACCNPQHLEPVTPLVNMRRSPFDRSRRTHCPIGHPYDAENTYHHHGRRYCRICQRVRVQLWKELSPAQRARSKAAGLPVVDLAAYFADHEVKAS